jgi:hypothetical protein
MKSVILFSFFGFPHKLPSETIDQKIKFLNQSSTEPLKLARNEDKNFMEELVQTNLKVFYSDLVMSEIENVCSTLELHGFLLKEVMKDRLIFKFKG